jgi:hypothetical protein
MKMNTLPRSRASRQNDTRFTTDGDGAPAGNDLGNLLTARPLVRNSGVRIISRGMFCKHQHRAWQMKPVKRQIVENRDELE